MEKSENGNGTGTSGRDGSCTHASDFDWHAWQHFQAFTLRHVYVNSEGLVFNRSTHFHRKGCNSDSDFVYLKGSIPVRHTKRLVNLAYHQATSNFYHALIDWTPQFFVLSSVLHAMPGVPILAAPQQFFVLYLVLRGMQGVPWPAPQEWQRYSSISEPLLGVPLPSLPRLDISPDELFFADEVIVPLYQACGKPSPAIWRNLRSRFFLPQGGLPIFQLQQQQQQQGYNRHSHQPWQLRHPAADSDPGHDDVASSDWLVVVAHRVGTKKRVLGRFDELLQAVEKIFPPTRVRVFNGSLPILEARALFRRARLLIAGHGAAMANMVFMPTSASVLEIRPEKRPNACYHHLANACGLQYYLTFGAGDPEQVIILDVDKVSTILQSILDNSFPR
ncbi:hypothetical protein CLOM_g14618 [Closterium sp. NIES-68]|nr:hypothetical protein CLOM_g14618 [Closterium sp. NIES-68]